MSEQPGWRFFIALSRYLVDSDVVMDHLVEHRAWAKGAYDAGLLLFSGRRNPPTGGTLGFRAEDLAQAERFVSGDPFVVNGIALYEVIEVTPTPFPWRNGHFDDFLAT